MQTHQSVVRWLTSRVAFHLEAPSHSIDPDIPLAEMGIDSVRALGLVGDVESQWDIEVDPTMVFDYPTLTDIAEFINESVDSRALLTA